MLTPDEINAVTDLGKAISDINAREQKTLANTTRRYAIERGRVKAEAIPRALELHGIDLETDQDVATYRASE